MLNEEQLLRVIIKKHHLRKEFSPGVLKEARMAAAKAPGSNREEYRRDLRSWNMVTIDGEDAKDLDDAVSVTKAGGCYRLGVHIADVSHYVKENSGMDKEAWSRGSSVYLIDKVLPMLPPDVSNGICSLNAQEERLAISCLMDIDQSGKVNNYELIKSLITVNERMTYTAVNMILSGEKEGIAARSDHPFFLMQELAVILRQKRMKRGALDFDLPETKVIVDENSFPVEIKRMERGEAERIIEEFMIQANEVVAEHMFKRDAPLLYRVHEKPNEEAASKLNQVLGVFGYKLGRGKINPLALQKVLQKVKNRPEERLISLMILRSMKHACYTPQALGHFGLASPYYCHFTSPIRRYPDLLVHRVLSAMLDKSYNAAKKARYVKKITSWGEHLTLQEIKAEEAERELLDIKKAQYMKQYLGDIFVGEIASVMPFGLFVALDNTVEGLVHISGIADDYYIYNDRNYTLTGKHKGRHFAIGDRVKVQLVRVSVEDAKIDFELV